MDRYALIDSTDDGLFEGLEVMTHEGRLKSSQLVEDAPQRPDIAFVAVGLFEPNLGTGVVGSTCLCTSHAVGSNDGHVHVCELDLALVLGEEDVGGLDVPV